MDRERLLMLRAVIDAVIALPDYLRSEVARWLMSGNPKPTDMIRTR
jgi:hypothetical protein